MIEVYTVGERFIFTGEDVDEVFSAINSAGARNAGWTTPIKLKSGKQIMFVLDNIVAIEFTP